MSTRTKKSNKDTRQRQKYAPSALVMMFIAFVKGLVYEYAEAAKNDLFRLVETRHMVGEIAYIQVTGPVAYVTRAIEALRDKSSIIVIGVDKYADRITMVYHLGNGRSSLVMPEDLLTRIFADGCYVPVTKLGHIGKGRFMAIGGQWLGCQNVQNALFQIARAMFNRDGTIIGAPGCGSINTFLAPMAMIGMVEFSTWTIYGPDTTKNATIADKTLAASFMDRFLFRTNRQTGETFIAKVDDFVAAVDFAWTKIGTFAAQIAEIAAIKQADNSIVLVGTAEEGEYFLIPMQIKEKDGVAAGTVDKGLCVPRTTQIPYGNFAGLTAGRKAAIFQASGATSAIDLNAIAGLHSIFNGMRTAASA